MKLEEALNTLTPGRKAKQLQGLWPAIEAKFAQGVSHVEILRILNQNGFSLTERTYKSYLYRYRKKQRAVGRNPARAQKVEGTKPGIAPVTSAQQMSAVGSANTRPATFDFDPRGISPELLK